MHVVTAYHMQGKHGRWQREGLKQQHEQRLESVGIRSGTHTYIQVASTQQIMAYYWLNADADRHATRRPAYWSGWAGNSKFVVCWSKTWQLFRKETSCTLTCSGLFVKGVKARVSSLLSSASGSWIRYLLQSDMADLSIVIGNRCTPV